MSPFALLPAAVPAISALASGAARMASDGLSFAAKLAELSPSEKPAEVAAPQPTELPAELEQALEEFADLLRERMKELGMTICGPIGLSADVLGDVQVEGNGSEAEAVEQILAHDRELSERFFSLAAAWKQAMGQPDLIAASMPWDTSGAARDVVMIVSADDVQCELT